VVVDQDVDILNKLYPNTPQKIKLNNEVAWIGYAVILRVFLTLWFPIFLDKNSIRASDEDGLTI
jgi:hypothetical protein